jgi:hypothetical protein
MMMMMNIRLLRNFFLFILFLAEVCIIETAVRIHHNEYPNCYLITADCCTRSPLPVTNQQWRGGGRRWMETPMQRLSAMTQGYASWTLYLRNFCAPFSSSLPLFTGAEQCLLSWHSSDFTQGNPEHSNPRKNSFPFFVTRFFVVPFYLQSVPVHSANCV